jgi:tetratricopeptide (TPR) repeat protein
MNVWLVSLSLLVLAPVVQASDSYTHYMSGLVAERRGDLATALAEYQAVVENDPEALEVYKDIAQVNLRAGRLDDALKAAEKVKDLSPKDSASLLFLGNVHVARGEFKKAIATYEDALKIDPNNLHVLQNLGNFYAATNPKLAFDYYDRYLTIEPDAPEIYFHMGLLHQRLGERVQAVSAFRKAIDLAPYNLAPHLALAELYEIEKSTAEAIASYQEAAKLDPRNPVLQFKLGRVAYDTGRWAIAETAFQNVKALTPQDPAVHYWLARTYEERKAWKQASDAAAEAYKLGKNPQFLPLQAYYLSMQRRTAECAAVLEQARAADPKNPNTLLFLGMAYLDLRKPEKALPLLEQAAKLAPAESSAQFQLGVAYDRMNRFEDAIAQFEKVLKIDPKSASALNYLGYTFADKNIRLDEADTLLTKALEIDPKNPAYLDSMGWLRYRQGRYEDAIKALQEAVEKAPDAIIYEHLGDAAYAKGDHRLALESYAKAVALEPKEASKLSKRLKELDPAVQRSITPTERLLHGAAELKEITTAQSRIQLKGRWKGQSFEVVGSFRYESPDRLRLEIFSPMGEPFATIHLQGTKLTVEPAEAAAMMEELNVIQLGVITEFFSGVLLEAIARDAVTKGWKRGAATLTGSAGRATVDVRSGLPRTLERGPLIVTFDGYTVVNDRWLPRVIRLNDASWKATITFSEWSL